MSSTSPAPLIVLTPQALSVRRPEHAFIERVEHPSAFRVHRDKDCATIIRIVQRSRAPLVLALSLYCEDAPAVERLIGLLLASAVPTRVLIARGIADLGRADRFRTASHSIHVVLGDLEPVAPLLCAYAHEDANAPAGIGISVGAG